MIFSTDWEQEIKTFPSINLYLCKPQVSSNVGGGRSGSVRGRCCKFELLSVRSVTVLTDTVRVVDRVSLCDHQVECNSKLDPTTTSFLKVTDLPSLCAVSVSVSGSHSRLVSFHRWLMPVVSLSWPRWWPADGCFLTLKIYKSMISIYQY